MYEFARTGQLLPILVGTTMADPSGSKMEVPILGAERDKFSSNIRPLGGTMEDPQGGGSVPIMIGNKAVDPVTGELSPISGVRTNPETNTVVPVTLTSGGHKKRKPPVGAVALLDEEVVARRGFWRRQRQRETELTKSEFLLALQLLFDVDNVNNRKLESQLNSILEGAHELSEEAKEETKRRSDAEEEIACVLPPDVIAVLTHGDQCERDGETAHHAAHRKFVETVRKFFNKLQAEEKKYRDRLADLEGAMNPSAEETVHQRYKQAKSRLHAELRDQIMNKMENLDEEHETLEYARQRSELLTIEAKAVLTGAVYLAGDYDCMLSGMYGESDLLSSGSDSSNNEMIPLLKQLIAMLESGGPFTLSSELINMIQGGNTNIHLQGDLSGQGSGGQGQQGGVKLSTTQTGKSGERVVTQAVQRSAPGGGSVISDAQFTAITDPSKLSGPLPTSDQERKERRQELFVKQAYEAAKLENDLRNNEINSINNALNSADRKKEQIIMDVQNDLRKQLSRAKNDAEKEKLMMEFATNLQKLDDSIEKQKHKKLEALRKELLDQRRQRKKELHKSHVTEAKSHGLPPDSTPDMTIPSYEELDHDLRKLIQQEEQQLADLQKSTAEVEDKDNTHDANVEARIETLRAGGVTSSEVLKGLKHKADESKRKVTDLKQKLKQRKDRRTKKNLEELQGLTEAERQNVLAIRQAQDEADRLREENAMIAIYRMIQEIEQTNAQQTAVNTALSDKDEAERQKLMSKYDQEQFALKNKLDNQRNAQMNAMHAKLATRKRMQEELDKERAVALELDRITKVQAAKGDEESAKIITQISGKLNTDTLSSDEQQLHDKQEQRQSALEMELRAKEQAHLADLEKELHHSLALSDRQCNTQKQMMLDAQKAKFDRELLLHGKNLSEQEFESMMAAHRVDMEKLEKNMDEEKHRQRQVLEEKLAARRKHMKEAHDKQREAAMIRELCLQQQERDRLASVESRALEDQVLGKAVQDMDEEAAENAVHAVVRQRHLKEAVHLEDQLAREAAAKIAEARAQVLTERAEDRDKIMAAHEQELMDLINNSSSLSSTELAAKKAELRQKQQQQLAGYDSLTKQLADQAEKELLPILESEQHYARLALRDIQTKEMLAALKKYTPNDKALIKKYEDEASKVQNETKWYRDGEYARLQKLLDQQKERLRKMQEERKKKMAARLRELEAELEAEQKRDAERERQRAAEREQIRKMQLAERDRLERERIEKMNIAEEERQRLLREHEANMKKFEDSLMNEQKRSEDVLKSKLEARRAGKKASEQARIEKDLILEEEEARRREMLLKMEDASRQRAATPSGSENGGKPGSQQTVGAGKPALTGNAEQDWVNMLMASPLFQQINDLQAMLDKDNAGGAGGAGRVIGGDYSRAYMDVKDAQWMCQGDLKPVTITDMSPSQFVVYRFGVFVIRLLHETIQTPDVTLLLASNLSPNNYHNNCYRHSFFYERARKVLFIRKERMESVGDFVLVILHTLAHISVDELTDDSNPLFLRQFYKALRVVCQDMFFSRSRGNTSLIGSPSVNGRSALESAFRLTRHQEDKTNVVAELLDLKATQPTSEQFSEKTLPQRLEGYEKFSNTARLRQILQAKGGSSSAADIVKSRLAELQGHKLPEPTQSLTTHTSGVAVRSQADLLRSQLAQLQGRCDGLNAELAQVMKSENELKEGLSRLGKSPTDKERVQITQSQLDHLTTRKQALMSQIKHMDADINKKKKEVSSAK